ncbi:hypothetical protein GTO89_05075 [Heliobacterium gestii]|uniref:Uncharacterized protein n=1 Tax=Heliomicrobium gestii TaxID=2699 RepID=A0A845LFZ9_HELGE|nr:hypothetical protein [Heliomicrobium gestii]MBM7866991.1 hypothetical protein [Heliomicrobium gestii]MZP42413.1 hypothetical protein [Heliomicrobium gestii]
MDKNLELIEKFYLRFLDCLELVNYYHLYLNLGLFYSEFSKRKSLVDQVNEVSLDQPTEYILDVDSIKHVLNAFSKNPMPDFFSGMTVINSIRGFTMSVYEFLNDTENGGKIFEQILIEEIFNENEDDFFNFRIVLSFIRNVLSHNISYNTNVKYKDIASQIRWMKNRGINDQFVRFKYPYSESPLNCYGDLHIKIKLNFGSLKPDEVLPFNFFITEPELFKLGLFCYHTILYLSKYAEDVFKEVELLYMLPKRFINVGFSHFGKRITMSLRDLLKEYHNGNIKFID